MNADILDKESRLMEKIFKNPEYYPTINDAFVKQGDIRTAINDYLDAQKRLNEVSAKCTKLVDKCVSLETLVSKLEAENHDAYCELIRIKSYWLVRVVLKFSKALNSLPKLRIEW